MLPLIMADRLHMDSKELRGRRGGSRSSSGSTGTAGEAGRHFLSYNNVYYKPNSSLLCTNFGSTWLLQ